MTWQARAEAHWLAGKPELGRQDAERAAEVAEYGSPWDRGGVAAWLRRAGSMRQLGFKFISPKTVDHHVSAVLGKLGAQSRKAAAAHAARLGIATPAPQGNPTTLSIV